MGVWVKGTRYGDSGKRHYYESDEIAWYFKELPSNPLSGIKWQEYMVNLSICSALNDRHGHSGEGKAYWSDWKNGLVYERGLSIKDESEVKLTQANLCFYCKTRYIKSRPELEQALKELGVI